MGQPSMHATKTLCEWPGRLLWPVRLALLTGLIFLGACSSPGPQPGGAVPTPPVQPEQAKATPSVPATAASQARTFKDYRRDAARHIYAKQSDRIYPGRLPPLLYAIGVLHVDIDRRGQVLGVHWQRAPRHAPEVMREIEKIVRSAAPYPVPQQMGQVTYTDVWLWHKSGRFQLDTLTEGQD